MTNSCMSLKESNLSRLNIISILYELAIAIPSGLLNPFPKPPAQLLKEPSVDETLHLIIVLPLAVVTNTKLLPKKSRNAAFGVNTPPASEQLEI
ncbi:MAG: hypothetical protein QM652_11125 [Legionella sp.]|uniref:hypothetical protein n=1 Tax=Legionella sp. TaxID=459 RepID=UPI0039E3A70C